MNPALSAEWRIGEPHKNSLGFYDSDGDECIVYRKPGNSRTILLTCDSVWIDRETARKLASVLLQFAETGKLREPIE